MLIIKNGNVLLSDGRTSNCDVLINNGLIEKTGSNLTAEQTIDAGGNYVLPGFIDLHNHGILTEDTINGSLKNYAGHLARFGVTTVFATLFDAPDVLLKSLQRHVKETGGLKSVPQVAGFRLESPYLASAGGGLSKHICKIEKETTNALITASQGLIRIWDVSPELDGAMGFIDEISNRGVVCSIAHTRCSIEQARMAVESGAKLVTHFYDTFVLPEVTEQGVYPAGLVDYMLLEDRLTCEVIPDGTHVPALLVEKTFRCKGPNRIAFVTDSNYGAGFEPGEYVSGMTGERIIIRGVNDGIRLPDRGMGLAGSPLTPLQCFKNSVELFNKDIATASRVCSKTPAELTGLNKGEIAVGKDADIVILDKDFEVVYTIVKGNIIFCP